MNKILLIFYRIGIIFSGFLVVCSPILFPSSNNTLVNLLLLGSGLTIMIVGFMMVAYGIFKLMITLFPNL